MAEKNCKYYREQKWVSYDYGVTYSPVEVYRRGALYEVDSQDCVDYDGKYFTFEAIDNCTFGITMKESDDDEYRTISYSIDNGATWNTLTSNDNPISVGAGNKVFWKNFYVNQLLGWNRWQKGSGTFTSTGRFDAYGSVMSLCWGDDYKEHSGTTRHGWDLPSSFDLPYAYFYYPFDELLKNNTGLTNTENMILPQTEGYNRQYGSQTNYVYNDKVYKSMFEGCTSLLTCPKDLPIIAVYEDAYKRMFYGCSSLTTVPIIHASSSYIGSFESMFEGCSSLVTTKPNINEINVTGKTFVTSGLTYSHFQKMFKNCSNLVEAPSINLSGMSCVNLDEMFKGCTSMTDVSDITADCIVGISMFEGCTSLEDSPSYPTSGCSLNNMFSGCTSLTGITIDSIIDSDCSGMYSHCTNLANANIVLNRCIQENMFSYCQSLVTPPTIITLSDLPHSGTDEKPYCKGMFESCGSLVNPPSITVVNELGYTGVYGKQFENMFKNCVSLERAATISSNIYGYPGTVQQDAYKGMYSGCRSLTAATDINAVGLNAGSIDYMYEDCTSLTTPPKINAYTLEETDGTFKGCTSLTASSEISLVRVYGGCKGMFSGLTNITTVSPITISGKTYGDIVSAGTSAFESMFSGCTGIRDASSIIIACSGAGVTSFSNMFNGCTALTKAMTILPATSIQRACYLNMFANCTSLTTAPELPATSLAQSCYYGMFSGCTSLTTAPELPANLRNSTSCKTAYSDMFKGCTSLNYIKCLTNNYPTNDYGSPYSTYDWVDGVAATGTFVKNASITTWPTGNSGIPNGWTVVDDA